MLISTAFAQDGAAGAPAGGMLEMFLPLILIFGVFYFLLIRPQQKRQKEHQAKLGGARRGDKVVLGGGMMILPRLLRRILRGPEHFAHAAGQEVQHRARHEDATDALLVRQVRFQHTPKALVYRHGGV